MGLFIGLEVSQKDLDNIEQFQEAIQLSHPVKAEEIHCTLFATSNDFTYEDKLQLPLEIKELTLGKIKTQSGVDCLVLFFESLELKSQYDLIKEIYQVKPYYPEFMPHLTLSYDCGDIDITSIKLSEYMTGLTFIQEYTQDLKFEVNKRKKVRE